MATENGASAQLFHCLAPLGRCCRREEARGNASRKAVLLIAFDTELVVQSGCRLFRTDEAIISPDWVSNENLICSYDSVNREFTWINRPYELTRVGYNAKMKEHREKNAPKSEALSVSPYANARASLKAYLESGKHVRAGEMQMTTKPEELPPLVRRREGQNGPFEDKVTA